MSKKPAPAAIVAGEPTHDEPDAPPPAPPPVPEKSAADAAEVSDPHAFLAEMFDGYAPGSVRIRQVGDGCYVIQEGAKIGYFKLQEGIDRADARAAVLGAYDGLAAVVG